MNTLIAAALVAFIYYTPLYDAHRWLKQRDITPDYVDCVQHPSREDVYYCRVWEDKDPIPDFILKCTRQGCQQRHPILQVRKR